MTLIRTTSSSVSVPLLRWEVSFVPSPLLSLRVRTLLPVLIILIWPLRPESTRMVPSAAQTLTSSTSEMVLAPLTVHLFPFPVSSNTLSQALSPVLLSGTHGCLWTLCNTALKTMAHAQSVSGLVCTTLSSSLRMSQTLSVMVTTTCPLSSSPRMPSCPRLLWISWFTFTMVPCTSVTVTARRELPGLRLMPLVMVSTMTVLSVVWEMLRQPTPLQPVLHPPPLEGVVSTPLMASPLFLLLMLAR
mmetsp:Transcript_27419/g.33310  ORF Transcript_27419/g.33310 Transcript_27419/m.33310 type:complete len:245 (-) Transcript_27419:9886-10620(-)